jgi:peptidoglycan hydrolase-like protein with peptidoglycan-binding domain
MRATRLAVPAVVLLAVGAAGAWRAAAGSDSADGATPDATATATKTAAVERRDLSEREELDGTLGYGDTRDLSLAAQGTLTALPAVGAVVDRGQTIAEVDGRPVPLLLGNRPLWRELGPGVDDGSDVTEVELNLVALGVVGSDDLTVDQTWTSATTEAVKDWQESLGLEETGRVGPGSVLVQPSAVRVAARTGSVGNPASGPVLTVSGTTRQVSVELDADQQSLVRAGQAVEIELPDGSTTKGKVAKVGTVATVDTSQSDNPDGGDNPTPTIEVTVSLNNQKAAPHLDEAPVTVRVVTSSAKDVLAVPVDALLALAEGGYAVERKMSDGTTKLVAVQLGAFADGWVEVTGDGLAEGDDVEVPA